MVAESLYIRRSEATGDEDDTEPVVLQPLIDRGLLEVLRLETDDEAVSFISLAAEFDDGEAMTCALAVHRSAVVATDDRKARRICSSLIPPLLVQTTAAMIQAWADVRQIPDEGLRQILSGVRERARFAPGRHDHPRPVALDAGQVMDGYQPEPLFPVEEPFLQHATDGDVECVNGLLDIVW